MPRAEREWVDRIDDGILSSAEGLARLRDTTIRAGVEDFRATAEQLVRDDLDDETGIWRLRIDRCNAMLSNPDDRWLRRRATEALEAER
jgi:hypothetical protein